MIPEPLHLRTPFLIPSPLSLRLALQRELCSLRREGALLAAVPAPAIRPRKSEGRLVSSGGGGGSADDDRGADPQQLLRRLAAPPFALLDPATVASSPPPLPPSWARARAGDEGRAGSFAKEAVPPFAPPPPLLVKMQQLRAAARELLTAPARPEGRGGESRLAHGLDC